MLCFDVALFLALLVDFTQKEEMFFNLEILLSLAFKQMQGADTIQGFNFLF
jgi:hypothetical protein